MKTLIQLEEGEPSRTHDLPGLLDELDKLAVRVGARTSTGYREVQASLRASSVLAHWGRTMRYRGPGVDPDDAERWCEEAKEAYWGTVGRLILDGAM